MSLSKRFMMYLQSGIVFEPAPGIPEKTQCWTFYSMITDSYLPKPDRPPRWVRPSETKWIRSFAPDSYGTWWGNGSKFR